jgi:NitT/TauT family transport system permease protein
LGPLATFVVLVVLWDVATRVFDWEPWLVPPPTDVAEALWDYRALLPEHTWVTVWESLAGFVLAIAVGIPLGGLIAYSRLMELTVYPILLDLNAVPKTAIAPILILWVGFGPGPKILVAFLLCVFPIVIATATGLKQTPVELVELARSLCASEWQTFRRFRFPSALPEIFIGLKVAISVAVIGAVIGEFVGASEGLGWVILAILAAISVVLVYAIALVERLIVPWARHRGS